LTFDGLPARKIAACFAWREGQQDAALPESNSLIPRSSHCDTFLRDHWPVSPSLREEGVTNLGHSVARHPPGTRRRDLSATQPSDRIVSASRRQFPVVGATPSRSVRATELMLKTFAGKLRSSTRFHGSVSLSSN